MIKPEILKMVEECKKPECGYSKCKWDKTCDEFMGLLLKSPVFYSKEKLKKIISFLTSQEVCVCEEWKEFKSKYVDIEGETWIAKVDDIETQGWYKFLFCPFCGGKIKQR